jgi:replicative DNA helicase
MRQYTTSISEYPLPDSLSTEIQIIADIISLPETLVEAERTISAEMFTDERCREAYEALRNMAKGGMVIDLPSAYGKIDKDLMRNGVIPSMRNAGSAISTSQHYASLKDFHIKRSCYFKAMELLIGSCTPTVSAQDLIGQAGSFADNLRKEVDVQKGTEHISKVLNDLGTQVEETMRNKAEGKVLRVPTGFYTLDYLTYGGFNCGNLVILAARPSVGKTAIMLQMARTAATAGKSVNLFNLEMTNTELAQRFLFATGRVTPLQMAKGEMVWTDFEAASAEYASKPIYLNDSAATADEILSRIVLNSQAGKCDIAFIDYLGLIQMDSRAPLYQAIAETTKRIKQTAKMCRIPIVLLCQLNRASASEKRAPMLYDLRDSGSIEQDADIVLMLERAFEDNGDDKDVNMWVRKNRQGKAGDIKVEITANDTFTAFTDKNDPTPPMPPAWEGLDSNLDFDNDSDIPF